VGDGSPYLGIEFDSKSTEFGPWLRHFIAQVRRNWKTQGAALQDKGHAVVTFEVRRDGTITKLKAKERSATASIGQAALKAVKSSSPTNPLPSEFPMDTCPFTLTVYCNELPPWPIRRP
jgi:TonB family protein